MQKIKATTVPEYIAAAPGEAQPKLKEIRQILSKVVPNATESLKWGSPVFEDKRILFAYAAFKTHINFMPTPSAMKPFQKELEKFKTGKGSIQFPYDKPLPKLLIRRIAKQRAMELKEKDAKWM